MNKISKEYWFVVATGILSGLIVFGGEVFKRLGFSLMELSILLCLPGFFILLPMMGGKKAELINWQNLKIVFLWALVGSFTIATQFGAIVAGTPVALVVLLLYTQPIWTILISKIFYKTKIRRIDLATICLVIIGLILLVKPWGLENIGNVGGITISLLGGLALSGWVILGSEVGKREIDPYAAKFLEIIMLLILSTVITLILGIIFNNHDITQFTFSWSWQIWLMVILYNLFTQVISHVLYLKGSKVVPAKDSGIILLLEPVSGAILAYLFLNQAITWNIAVGGALIIYANVLLIKNSSQKEEKTC